MSLTFNESAHEYTLNKRVVPGTHKIMGLAGALAGIPDNEEAKKRGSVIHKAIELDWKTRLGIGEEVLNEKVAEKAGLMGYVRAAYKAANELNITINDVEALVANAKWQYATKVDAVGLWRNEKKGTGRKVVINWKSGGHMPMYPIQMAAEAMCFKPSPYRLAIYVAEDGTYEWEEFTDSRDFEIWRAMLTVADWKLRASQSIRPRGGAEETEEDVILPTKNSGLFVPQAGETESDGGIFSKGKTDNENQD